jgi:hypothetical protein
MAAGVLFGAPAASLIAGINVAVYPSWANPLVDHESELAGQVEKWKHAAGTRVASPIAWL